MPTARPASPPGTRKQAAAQTRQILIDTGLKLAERTGLNGMSVNLLVQEAGVSKGSFFHHFGDRASYLLALHQEFHDRIDERIQQKVAGMPPGRGRLVVGATTYLDNCLQHRGVRALLLEARAEPAVAAEIATRNAHTAQTCAPDFKALGRRYPLQCAHLWVAMTAETALIELQAGKREPKIRAALEDFLH